MRPARSKASEREGAAALEQRARRRQSGRADTQGRRLSTLYKLKALVEKGRPVPRCRAGSLPDRLTAMDNSITPAPYFDVRELGRELEA